MKKNLRMVMGLLLCFALVISLAACSSDSSVAFEAGTYTATAQGNNGDVTVEVVFSDKEIVSVKILEHNETAGISDVPIERIPEEIVEGQTLAVDAVSGATNTSNAVLAAVEDCVKQAGGDVEALKSAASGDSGQNDIELTTDVVVVGGGGTGITAAASAYENGADVILIEKLAALGGSTGLSGGGISATGTRFQDEQGIDDTKESWMELWKERQNTSNPESEYPDYDRVDTFMDEAIDTTHWLVDYMGHNYARIEGFGFDPVRRIHFPESGGAELISNLETFIRDKGIEVLTETSATELMTSEEGDVIGVIADGVDGKVTIHAEKVILATGGFAKNPELLERFVPEMADTADLSIAASGSTGDGILMAEELGAALYEDPWIIGMGMTSKIPELGGLNWDTTKVLVNENGERFMNESSHYAIVTNKVAEQDSVWMVLDSSDGNSQHIPLLEAALPNDEIAVGETIEELAEAMGVSEDAFVKTMSDFNEGVKSGKDDFDKAVNTLVPVETGSYYAVKYYPATMGTFGGVKTDENYRVLRGDGSVINNLYAGGECSNRILYNQVYMSGSAVQLALTSGRISGAHAAQSISD